MASDQERGSPEDLGQDPYVERLRPDPSRPLEEVRILEGLLGDSDREGYKRLYFNRELDRYAEFRVEDVLFSEPIPPDQPPVLGKQAFRSPEEGVWTPERISQETGDTAPCSDLWIVQ
jgi:hypothetical protein